MDETRAAVAEVLPKFQRWLEAFGETSYDHQTFFAGGVGGRAKRLYYKSKPLGMLAVAPMVFCEAFLPSARKFFWKKQRLPIADAHYAMAFCTLFEADRDRRHYDKAVHFLQVLEETRAPKYRNHGWGYPFDWVTSSGIIPAGTPLITTTAYVYEAFAQANRACQDERWTTVMESIAEHVLSDIREFAGGNGIASAGYDPTDTEGGVVNASAYRASLLFSAASHFDRVEFQKAAERNLGFVLSTQHADGSWPYSVNQGGAFIDHFHTCFVLKALTNIEALTGREECTNAIMRGIRFYVDALFDGSGLPVPFARAPRLTVYRRELYDYAECINLGNLLSGRFPELDARVISTLKDLLDRWCKKDGSFRSRELLLGWDEVPMHRWAQAQLFRSLCGFVIAPRLKSCTFESGKGARRSAESAVVRQDV